MNLISKISPPKKWKFLVIVLSGAFVGLSILLIYLSKAPSYLTRQIRNLYELSYYGTTVCFMVP